MEPVFYRCPVCGNVMVVLVNSGIVPVCCGKPMEKLEANTVDAKTEAHVPAVKCTLLKDCVKPCYEVNVQVGSMLHPATKEHHICFVYLVTKCGGEVKMIKDEDEAKVTFYCGHKPQMVYAYCNLHLLWKSPVKCPD